MKRDPLKDFLKWPGSPRDPDFTLEPAGLKTGCIYHVRMTCIGKITCDCLLQYWGFHLEKGCYYFKPLASKCDLNYCVFEREQGQIMALENLNECLLTEVPFSEIPLFLWIEYKSDYLMKMLKGKS